MLETRVCSRAHTEIALINVINARVQDPELDAVFVLTNMETHAELAIRAMNQGKPVASSVAELESMKAAAEANGVVCVSLYYDYHCGSQYTLSCYLLQIYIYLACKCLCASVSRHNTRSCTIPAPNIGDHMHQTCTCSVV